MPSLIERLKKKKVVQWALGYLAGAFVVLQLMDALEAALDLSPHAQQGILALLASGLVVTVILAWFHGNKGHQRVRPAEIIALGVTVVLGISASVMLWVGTGKPSTQGTSVEATLGSVPSVSPGAGEPASQLASDTTPTSAGGDQVGLAASESASAAPEETPMEDRRPATERMPHPALTPEDPTLFDGDSIRLELDTDLPAQWTSSNHTVAMVMSDGLVLAVGPGSARIVATLGEAEVSTHLTVRTNTATEVEITPVDPVRPGESVRPEVVVRMANGQIRGRAGLQWSSSDSSVIEIENRGTLAAVSPGSARITAESDGVAGSIVVIVEAETQSPTRPVSADVLFPILERYRAALESQDMEGVTDIYPGIALEEKAGWETLFRLGELSVDFSGLTVLGISSTTAEVEFEQVLSGSRIERNVTKFIATLSSDGEGWRIQQLRAVGSRT